MGGLPAWARYDPDKDVWTLRVHVQPGVRNNQVVGEYGGSLKLKIAAPAVDNMANKCLSGYLAEQFGVAPRQVSLVRGETTRQKTIVVQGAGPRLPASLGYYKNDT